jgi:hypothetical protein
MGTLHYLTISGHESRDDDRTCETAQMTEMRYSHTGVELMSQ